MLYKSYIFYKLFVFSIRAINKSSLNFLRRVILFVFISFNVPLQNRLKQTFSYLMTRPVNIESHNVLIMSCAFDLRLTASKLIVILFFFSCIYSNFHLFFKLLPFTCAVFVISHLAFNSAGKQRIKILLIIVLTSSSWSLSYLIMVVYQLSGKWHKNKLSIC